MNRKPLRTHGSLAQPCISGNGLYSTAGHLVESHRLREDVLDFYGAADLYVSPTREDSFGLPVAEAMACGLPVITSMNAGVADLIHDGTDGFILRQIDDAQGLAQMLQRLHTDGLLRGNAGDVAAQTAAHWTWDHNATVVWELLKERASKKLLAPARKP